MCHVLKLHGKVADITILKEKFKHKIKVEFNWLFGSEGEMVTGQFIMKKFMVCSLLVNIYYSCDEIKKN